MIWIRLFAFSAIDVVFRSCVGYHVKSIMNDARNREEIIGKVLESYVKPFKRLSENFPRHDVEIQLEFQRPQMQQASKLIQKRPIYRDTFKRPNFHVLHGRGNHGVDYLAERNANEHYPVQSRNTMEYLPFENVVGSNTLDNFVSRGVIDNYGAGNVFDGVIRHNSMDNFGNHNGINNLAGHNTAMDNLGNRNSMSNNAGYSKSSVFAGNNAKDSFARHNAMIMNYPGIYPMNHGVSNVIGQETVQVDPMAPTIGKGVPQVARQADTEATTTEATVPTSKIENKGPSLNLDDIRKLFDEYLEKIISSKTGNENQKSDNNQLPQVYIQDYNGQIDDSMFSNLDRIANLIKKGVQIHKLDGNNQEGFLPKTGLNWMRIKVPAR